MIGLHCKEGLASRSQALRAHLQPQASPWPSPHQISSNHSSPFLTSAARCWLKWINLGLFIHAPLCSDFLTWKQAGKESIRKQTFHIFEDVECIYWSRASGGWAGTCLLTLYFRSFPTLGVDPWALIAITSLAVGFTSFPPILVFSWLPWSRASSPSPDYHAWSEALGLVSPRG